MRCACTILNGLDGVAAEEYAREHPEKIGVDSATWTKTFRCPDTGDY
jgi:hypothetical protein